MYNDLRSRLEMYKNKKAEEYVKPKAESGLDIHDLLEGTLCSNQEGCCFIVENRYHISHLHGGYPLGAAVKMNMLPLTRICPELKQGMTIDDFIFLDTETTGLSGGTGTVAFLIGLGRFEGEYFVLRQYFMRDYDEEPAMLEEVNKLFANCSGLISFNGKSFDWNLLLGRFTFNRMRIGLKEPVHIDLLFPSRQIWKLRLESCRLSKLEEEILGEHRVDDIPGALIPSVYFKYLEDRNAAEIKKVITHNQVDIISMVSLVTKMCNILENPLLETCEERELVGIGRIFEKSMDYNMVQDCYEACIKSEDSYVKHLASKRLADMHKRNGNYTGAVECWQAMVEGSHKLDTYPMIELAKYYEHKEKNIKKALDIVEKALEASTLLGCRGGIHNADLKKRHERLKRKAGGNEHA